MLRKKQKQNGSWEYVKVAIPWTLTAMALFMTYFSLLDKVVPRWELSYSIAIPPVGFSPSESTNMQIAFINTGTRPAVINDIEWNSLKATRPRRYYTAVTSKEPDDTGLNFYGKPKGFKPFLVQPGDIELREYSFDVNWIPGNTNIDVTKMRSYSIKTELTFRVTMPNKKVITYSHEFAIFEDIPEHQEFKSALNGYMLYGTASGSGSVYNAALPEDMDDGAPVPIISESKFLFF